MIPVTLTEHTRSGTGLQAPCSVRVTCQLANLCNSELNAPSDRVPPTRALALETRGACHKHTDLHSYIRPANSQCTGDPGLRIPLVTQAVGHFQVRPHACTRALDVAAGGRGEQAVPSSRFPKGAI